jgi:hypothetical protein
VPPTSRSATIETDLFEHRTPKDDFINPCCFGEDFAAWLQVRLSGLTEFKLGAPVMEDAKGSIWVALSFAHEGPVEGPASWGVSVEWRDAKLLNRWLGKPDLAAFDPFVDAVWAALKAEPAITFTPD